jgi:hypothetical protein
MMFADAPVFLNFLRAIIARIRDWIYTQTTLVYRCDDCLTQFGVHCCYLNGKFEFDNTELRQLDLGCLNDWCLHYDLRCWTLHNQENPTQ